MKCLSLFEYGTLYLLKLQKWVKILSAFSKDCKGDKTIVLTILSLLGKIINC